MRDTVEVVDTWLEPEFKREEVPREKPRSYYQNTHKYEDRSEQRISLCGHAVERVAPGKRGENKELEEPLEHRPDPALFNYSRHRCVLCDYGRPHLGSLCNPEIEERSEQPIEFDELTGLPLCLDCERAIRKLVHRLRDPTVKLDARGRTRVSETASAEALVEELEEECPSLYAALVSPPEEAGQWTGDRMSLGDGGYRRYAAPAD